MAAGSIYLEHGDTGAVGPRIAEELAKTRTQAEREPANAVALSFLSAFEALLGHREEAIQLARKAADMMPESRDALDSPTYRFNLAWVDAVIGDKDRAVDELSQVLRVPAPFSVRSIRNLPPFKKLIGDQKFEALLNDPKNNAPLF